MATKKKPTKKIKKSPVKVKRVDESNDDPIVFDTATDSVVSSVSPMVDPSGVVVMKPEQDYDKIVDPSLVVTIKPPKDDSE